ncbi:MAG: helix-turn-helix domain-containing protein [Methylocella sp.]
MIKNAKTTAKMRALIAARRQAGETPRTIASAVGVSPAPVTKWLRRFRNEDMAGLQAKTSRPHLGIDGKPPISRVPVHNPSRYDR